MIKNYDDLVARRREAQAIENRAERNVELQLVDTELEIMTLRKDVQKAKETLIDAVSRDQHIGTVMAYAESLRIATNRLEAKVDEREMLVRIRNY